MWVVVERESLTCTWGRVVWRGGMACSERKSDTKGIGSVLQSSCGVKYPPGRQRLVPYTSSAAVQPMSSFKAVRIPRRAKGNASVQRPG